MSNVLGENVSLDVPMINIVLMASNAIEEIAYKNASKLGIALKATIAILTIKSVIQIVTPTETALEDINVFKASAWENVA